VVVSRLSLATGAVVTMKPGTKKKKKFKPKIAPRPKSEVATRTAAPAATTRRNATQRLHRSSRPHVKSESASTSNKAGALAPAAGATSIAPPAPTSGPQLSAADTARAASQEALAAAEAASAAAHSPPAPVPQPVSSAKPTPTETKQSADVGYGSSTPLPSEVEVPISLSASVRTQAPAESLDQWLLNEDNHGCCMSFQLPSELPVRTQVKAEVVTQSPPDGYTTHDDLNTFLDPRTVPNHLSSSAATLSGSHVDSADEGDDGPRVSSLGKLRVHESGRVTMLIGGVEFDVETAIDTSFLQEASEISLESDENSQERHRIATESNEGVAPGQHFFSSGQFKMFGPIEQRVICCPNIDALLAQVDLDEES